MSLIMEIVHSDGPIFFEFIYFWSVFQGQTWLWDLILSQHGLSDIDEILITKGRACEQIHHDNRDTPSTDNKEKASWPWAGNVLGLGKDDWGVQHIINSLILKFIRIYWNITESVALCIEAPHWWRKLQDDKFAQTVTGGCWAKAWLLWILFQN